MLKICSPLLHNRNLHLVQSGLYTFISVSQGKLWHFVFSSWGHTFLIIKISFPSLWRLSAYYHICLSCSYQDLRGLEWVIPHVLSVPHFLNFMTDRLFFLVCLIWNGIGWQYLMKFPVWREELWNPMYVYHVWISTMERYAIWVELMSPRD